MTDSPSTIAIVTDASADVPAAERSAGVTPWHVASEVWHGQRLELPDLGEASPQLVRLALRNDIEPVEPGFHDMCRVYDELREFDRVFSVHAPAQVSVTVDAAREAAGAYPNVRVIESNVTGIGVGLLAACARDLADDGASPDDVETWLRDAATRVRMVIVPDRFDPMGGQRMSASRLLTGRPVLSTMHDGSGGFARTRRLRSRRATVAAIERYVRANSPADTPLQLAVGHGDAAGAVDPFLDLFERLRPRAEVVLVGRIGPRLVQQLGARCVGAAWIIAPDAV